MRLLLDTHILLAVVRKSVAGLKGDIAPVLQGTDNELFASAASLWEIAIKSRLGKLDPGMPLADLPGFLLDVEINSLSVEPRHAVAALTVAPATRDPFDRLLLTQCEVEGLRLVTVDRILAVHPLAWSPA